MHSHTPGTVRTSVFQRFPYFLIPILLLLTMSGTGTMTAGDLLPFEQYTLANGLTVILHQDRSTPVAALMMMYHVGSKNEKPGRTGFAHLFEHMMFKGSAHVADGEHFKLLQEIGANINGSTSEDRTNYFEVVPSNALELALYLESDRMGFLLDAVNQSTLDNQRDVVKNERRQNYDNQPYGTSYEKIAKALYPAKHPYSWPVIGSMEDLSAAALEDVKDFFRTYYAPNNACLVIAGNYDPAQTKEWIAKYFGPFPKGKDLQPMAPAPVSLDADKRMVFEDKVQLPRLYITWPSARLNTREDAVRDVLGDILGSGMNSRLYKSLVYEKQIAQSVSAGQSGSEIAGEFQITVTAKPGKSLADMESAVNAEIARLLKDGVTVREIETAVNNVESRTINRIASSLGQASALATAFTLTGDAGNVNRELKRYEGITPEEVLNQATAVLNAHKVVLSIVPAGKTDLSADQKPAGKEMPK
jgi:zinc protease